MKTFFNDKNTIMNPFFSIIIPCCNVGPYVSDCLQSILNQPFQDWECFAVVETSQDNTEKIVREFAKKDDRIHFFVGPRSGSASVPRNTGLDHAHGKYVLFVDGDDYILENSLGRIAEKIASHPDADIYPCCLRVHRWDSEQEEIWNDFRAEDPVEMTGPETIRLFLHREIPRFMMPICVFRCDFLNQNKLRFVPRMRYEDLEFFPRALYLAKRIVPIHEVHYLYRIRKNSVTTSGSSGLAFIRSESYRQLNRAHALYNLCVFYMDISKKGNPDSVVSTVWKKWIFHLICTRWFYSWRIRKIPRKRRLCTLRHVFQTPDVSPFLMENEPFIQKLKVYFMYLSVRHPKYGALIADLFFLAYYQLVKVRDAIKKHM